MTITAASANPAAATQRRSVLFVYFVLPNYRLELFRKLREEKNWNITVLCTPYEQAPGGVTGIPVEDHQHDGIHIIHSRRRNLPLGFWLQSDLLKTLRSGRFDAAILQAAPRDLSSSAGMIWSKLTGFPCIWWNKGFAAESKRGWLIRKFLRFYNRLPRVIIPYGDESVDYFVNSGVTADCIVQAYNTVDVEGLAAEREELVRLGKAEFAKLGIPESDKVLATVGRLIPKKRTQDLIRAAAQVMQSRNDLSVVIVGTGADADALKEEVRQNKLEQKIFLTGRVGQDLDSAILAAADAAVFCGAHGLAINQAQALETPVLVADEPGPDAEMVVNGVTGFRFRKADPDALRQLIDDFLANRLEVDSVVAAAKNEILQRRNLQNYVNAFDEALKRALR